MPDDRDKRRLKPREVLALVLATYRASLPYLLLFIAVLLLATWVLTEIVF